MGDDANLGMTEKGASSIPVSRSGSAGSRPPKPGWLASWARRGSLQTVVAPPAVRAPGGALIAPRREPSERADGVAGTGWGLRRGPAFKLDPVASFVGFWTAAGASCPEGRLVWPPRQGADEEGSTWRSGGDMPPRSTRSACGARDAARRR